MTTALRLFTSESVTEGHPDKICDQISDSILDAMLAEDPKARVAVETLVTTGLVHVAGEVTTRATSTSRRSCASKIVVDRLRLVAQGLRRSLMRRRDLDRCAVPRHRPGRRQRASRCARTRPTTTARPPGRRRPGHHVRLRDNRDQGAHAPADLAGAPARRATLRGAQDGPARLPAPRRQDPGHHRLRRHHATHGRHRRALDAARARGRERAAARRDRGARDPPGARDGRPRRRQDATC